MLLHEGLTRVHSQKKPRLHFGKSFTFKLIYYLSNWIYMYIWPFHLLSVTYLHKSTFITFFLAMIFQLFIYSPVFFLVDASMSLEKCWLHCEIFVERCGGQIDYLTRKKWEIWLSPTQRRSCRLIHHIFLISFFFKSELFSHSAS